MQYRMVLLLAVAASFYSGFADSTEKLDSSPSVRSAPSLSNQEAWTDKEKKDFLDYLKVGGCAPSGGEVRSLISKDDLKKMVKVERDTSEEAPKEVRKPIYFAIEMGTGMTAFSTASTQIDQALTIGPRFLLGGHVSSWIRTFFGFEFAQLPQGQTDGTHTGTNHFQVPFGFELALIPLGSPHTRYILLRGGLSAHYIQSTKDASVFSNPVLGFQGTWNLGLGYEWQIAETPLRLHVLGEWQVPFNLQATRIGSIGIAAGMSILY